jgi:formylglycine-generating enzyme required for sulfatase activity
LVGVDKYSDLRQLDCAASDQWALASRLQSCGFPKDQIIVLASQTPTGQNNEDVKRLPIQRNVLRWLSNIVDLTHEGDTLIVAFSGHGIQIGEHNYLCPIDADPEDPEHTMIKVEFLNDQLKGSAAALKLLVLDAWHDDPRPTGKRSAVGNVEFDYGLPPDGVVSINSSSKGKTAREDQKKLGHGVFMHYFLEGLDGKAADAEGTITIGRLFDYVSRETDKYLTNEFGDAQRPVMVPEQVERVALIRAIDRRHSESAVPNKVTNTIGMKLVLVPEGEFTMGSDESADQLRSANIPVPDEIDVEEESPRHRVRITRPFYLGAHEVTVGQFRQFVTAKGYVSEPERDGKGGSGYNAKTKLAEEKSSFNWRSTGFPQSDEHPVVNVTWNDAVAFCQWLSNKEGKQYGLPTEAQWEYACRAGTSSRYSTGDSPASLQEATNARDASFKVKFPKVDFAKYPSFNFDDGYAFAAPVGQFRPNSFGLYDMTGNVWEWCSDFYDKEYYRTSPTDDPKGPATGSYRVLRGGGWYDYAVYCRSAYRYWFVPSFRHDGLGFRVSLVPSGQ